MRATDDGQGLQSLKTQTHRRELANMKQSQRGHQDGGAATAAASARTEGQERGKEIPKRRPFVAMRVLRAKAVRKFLKFYKIVFGIEPPYHVILDGNFIFQAFKLKIDIVHRLEGLLQERSLKFYVLQSSIDELKSVGAKASAALEWTLRCCEAINDSVHSSLEPVRRLMKVVEEAAAVNGKQRRHYFVASQDKEARQGAASIAGTPIIYLNQVTLVLEPPSSTSVNYRNTVEDVKTSLGQEETALLNKVSPKTREKVATAIDKKTREVVQVMRPKKRANAPNPLSQLKASDESSSAKKKKLGKYRQRG